jgi:hypothetical protein
MKVILVRLCSAVSLVLTCAVVIAVLYQAVWYPQNKM